MSRIRRLPHNSLDGRKGASPETLKSNIIPKAASEEWTEIVAGSVYRRHVLPWAKNPSRTPLLNLIKVAKLIHETSSGNEARILLTSKRVQKRQVAWPEVIGDTRWHMQHMLLLPKISETEPPGASFIPVQGGVPGGFMCDTLCIPLCFSSFRFPRFHFAVRSLSYYSDLRLKLPTCTITHGSRGVARTGLRWDACMLLELLKGFTLLHRDCANLVISKVDKKIDTVSDVVLTPSRAEPCFKQWEERSYSYGYPTAPCSHLKYIA